MNRKMVTIVAAVIIAAVIGGIYLYARRGQKTAPLPANNLFNQQTHSSQGFGTQAARVDSQITLKIPEGQAQAVYQYLRSTYIDHNNLLAKSFPGLKLNGENKEDISIFTDDYFDTSDLDLYKNNNSARHRKRINTTDPADKKSGRELVQIKVTPPGQFDTRSEVKFDAGPIDHKSKKPEDSHPLIGLVVKKQRNNFIKAFQDIGLNPLRLRPILTNKQTRSRVYLDWNGENFMSFSVDEGTSHWLWARAKITSVDVGLVENVYTAADPAKRAKLGQIRAVVLKDLQDHFPDLTVVNQEKYVILFDQLARQIPFLKGLIRFGIL